MLNRNFLVGCGVGGSDAHLYWRINVTKGTVSATPIRCSELYMYSVVGGPDITTGGTPFSGYSACDVGFGPGGGSAGTPAAAFDGVQYGSSWDGYANTCADGSCATMADCPVWLGYQFPTPVKIVQFAWAYPGSTLGANSGPTDFQLQWSDDPSGPWTTVFSKIGETWSYGDQTKTYTV